VDAPVTDDHVPARQDTHCDERVAETVEDQVPAPQRVQLDAPELDHVPAPHGKHCEATDAANVDEYDPGAHWIHWDRRDAPTEEDHVPDVQFAHARAPSRDHVPGRHVSHCRIEVLVAEKV
jgi:hypothetical protein